MRRPSKGAESIRVRTARELKAPRTTETDLKRNPLPSRKVHPLIRARYFMYFMAHFSGRGSEARGATSRPLAGGQRGAANMGQKIPRATRSHSWRQALRLLSRFGVLRPSTRRRRNSSASLNCSNFNSRLSFESDPSPPHSILRNV
ncbi:hypothetical protein MPTK1_7g03360 [Marchantia polymorpha subsp. ruderalis]|uniref:Uncharacterized protein n=2 Tax=Marchantia polymorpha TaxID=3197 RepID=A0AAF6BVQ7_MARPO|nr:hypothetical protein MARPO_0074s0060 [Marchantia polymorpha]BBN16091.1 hypothetical protein Mp_7g03360 [Marchantia polymorpha subsp. ruderalis]|eukprot:PTQ35074.1 hypothetical protein MARPO_0074s0060 [Marchantia polymorpha]